MKFFSATLIFLMMATTIVVGQNQDFLQINRDSSLFNTSNAFLIPAENYETFNNSFITGSSHTTIRSQDNPRVFVDGIPMNPIFINNIHYSEFMGNMHLLSYDLQEVSINTLSNDGKIISGYYNNAIGFDTQEIELGKKDAQFEVNNFTTMAYQDFDTIGYSTITNINTQRSYEKFGYRFSLSNGFQNDYIPENGLQRYSGNLKLKYLHNEKILLTGFVDYSNFQALKRTGDNDMKSNRLLTYLNTDITLTNQLQAYCKLGLNKISDTPQRALEEHGVFEWSGEPFSKIYFEKNDFNYNSSYLDLGLSYNKPILKNALLNLNFGYSFYGNKYLIRNETNFFQSHWNSFRLKSVFERKTKEKTLYTSLVLSNKFLSIQYLFNRTNYGIDDFFRAGGEKRSFSNHVISSNIDFVKNDDKIVNKLGLQLNYGRLSNYSIMPSAYDPPPGYEWIRKLDNDNIELNFYSFFLKNRVNVTLSTYRKFYDSYDRFFQLNIVGLSFASFESIGEITKKGFDLNANLDIVQTKKMNWLVSLFYSNNVEELDRGEDVVHWARPDITDTVINNKIISLTNSFRYKNIELVFDFEGKRGYDINLYEDNISVAQSFGVWQQFQVVGVDNRGVPISERTENSTNVITHTDYFILKHVGLEYKINNNTQRNKYAIGLHYNKMRRLYLYVNDVDEYQERFQIPSFYNALSLSFKMKL